MPKISEEQLADRRERILDGAARCFAKNGIHSTSIKIICEECGISAGLIYRYFDSKHDLVVALVERWDQQLDRDFATAPQTEDPLDDLVVLVDALLESLLAESIDECRLCAQFWAEAARDPETRKIQARRLDRFGRLIAKTVERCRESGRYSGDIDARAVATMVLTWAQGLVVHRIANPRTRYDHARDAMIAALGGTLTD